MDAGLKLALPVGLVAVLALAIAGCGGSSSSSSSSTSSEATTASTGGGGEACTGKVGVMVPATGEAAEQGQEQLKWAEFAVERFNEENGSELTMLEGDTQLDPAQASTIATQFASEDEILGVVGPPSSSEVESAGPVLDRAGLAMVSQGATSGELTTSGKYPNFFRVVPPDVAQGATDAKFMADELHAKQVMIIDDQSSYSTGLADAVEGELKKLGVDVERTSVSQHQTDYSSLVDGVPDEGVVFLPWLLAANAEQFGTQLRQAGKETTVFGGDGLFSLADFSLEGAYVASFAPDIKSIPADAELVKAYEAKYGEFGTYGPPTYAAAQTVLEAIKAGCESGGASREQVMEAVAETDIQNSILGYPIRFDENGDIENPEFSIFQIKNGKFVAAGK